MMRTSRQTERPSGQACTLLLMALVLGAVPRTGPAATESESSREYQLKAAFMYNFLMFVDGLRFQQKTGDHEGDSTDSDRAAVIGILGQDPFQEALEPLRDKRVRDHTVVIKRFKGIADLKRDDPEITRHPDQEAVSQCDLLFISSSEESYLNLILRPIAKERVLTVAEIPRFVEKGGMIGLLTEQHRIRFEVNVAVAKQADLVMRSKLLRLAKRVIEE